MKTNLLIVIMFVLFALNIKAQKTANAYQVFTPIIIDGNISEWNYPSGFQEGTIMQTDKDEFSTDYSQMFTTPKLGNVGRFIPVFDAKYGQVSDVNGNLFTQWRTVPNVLGTKYTGVQWGTPGAPGKEFIDYSGTEVWQVKYDCATGHSYLFIEGYGDKEGNLMWGARLTKAIFINLKTGEKFDITNIGSCNEGGGHPYMLFDLYDEPYMIKIWHDITDVRSGWSDKSHTVKRVYWEQTVRPFVEVVNPMWKGTGTSKRMTIHQAEAWWDNDGGWANHASGKMEAKLNPMTGVAGDGYQEPTGEDVVYAHDQWWGEGVDGDKSGWYAWKLFDRPLNHTGYLNYGWKY